MNKRIGWLDTVRTAAIFFVVLNHGVEIIYDGSVPMSTFGTFFATTLFSLGRLGVPLFLFLSGYLLLSREYASEKDCIAFWKTKWLPLLICWEIWTAVYWVFFCLNRNEPMIISELIEQMLMLRQSRMSHGWYLYMLLGLYPFFPLMANALQRTGTRVLAVLLLFAGLWTMGLPVVNDLVKMLGGKASYTGQLTLGLAGGIYGIMLVLGYLLTREDFFRLKTWQDLLGFGLCMGVTVLWQAAKYRGGFDYRVWYSFPLLSLGALFLTDFLRKLDMGKLQPIFRLTSECAFGIFLLHKPLQMLIRDTGIFLRMPESLAALTCTVLSFCLSLLGVWLLAKVPGVGKWLFLMKPRKK